MANNPLEMGQVIPRNVGFGCHFSFPLSPFLNTATGKERRIRSLKPRVPALHSLVSDSLDDISSLYSAAVQIILWVIYDLTNQSQQIQSLDYLLFSVCLKRMRIVSTTSMVRFMLSFQNRKLLQRAKPVLPLWSVTDLPQAVLYIQYFIKVGFLKGFMPPLESSFWWWDPNTLMHIWHAWIAESCWDIDRSREVWKQQTCGKR